jgi:excisionase family DNA binding protein
MTTRSPECAPRLAGGRGEADHLGDIDQLLVSARDACHLLSIGQRLLAELTAAGDVPSVKLGGRRLYPVADLRRWVEAGCPRASEGGAG